MFNLRLHSSLYFTFLNPDLCCQFLASRQSLVVFVWFRHRRRLVAGRCLLFTERLEAVAVVVPNRPQVLDTVPKVHFEFHSAEPTTSPGHSAESALPQCRTDHKSWTQCRKGTSTVPNRPQVLHTVPKVHFHSAEHTVPTVPNRAFV